MKQQARSEADRWCIMGKKQLVAGTDVQADQLQEDDDSDQHS